jgi:general secretion pathway protein K
MVETGDTHGLMGSAATRQSGVAVVTALLIVAVIATAATYVGLGQQVWLRQAQNVRERVQAEAVRHGALEWAAIILTLDARDNDTDDLTQAWAQVLPPLPAEGGLVIGQIVDAQGRFNLNNLLRDAGVSADDLAVFQRLLQGLELPTELADTLVDWLDNDSTTSPSGAEDIDYLANEPSYRAANQSLQSVDELYRIRGFSAEIINKLRPFVAALPQTTAININTASAELLQAMIQTLSLSEAQTLVDQRKDDPFKTVDDFKKRLPTDVGLPKVPYDVRSAYFEVNVATMFGRMQRRSRALLHRPAGAAVRILWQQQELVTSTGDGSG